MSSICDYPLGITNWYHILILTGVKFHINLSTVTTIVLTLVDSHNYLVHPPHCFTVWVSHHLSPPSLLSAPPHTPSHSLSSSTVTPTSSHWHHCASYCVTVYPLHQPSVTSILLYTLQLRHPHPLFRLTVYPSTQAPSPTITLITHTILLCDLVYPIPPPQPSASFLSTSSWQAFGLSLHFISPSTPIIIHVVVGGSKL